MVTVLALDGLTKEHLPLHSLENVCPQITKIKFDLYVEPL